MEETPPGRSRASCVLPEDSLYEILLRLLGQDVCRLRAVCRPWRSLLSHPHFIADHAARHPEPPLVVVDYAATEQNGRMLCDIVDLSGLVVKRVLSTGDDSDHGLETKPKWVMSTQLDLVCVAMNTMGTRCQLRNLATGAVHALPDGLAAEHAGHVLDYYSDCWASTVFGLVPSTGEYKIHRMIHEYYRSYATDNNLCEVCTLNGNPDEARWRRGHAPPYDVEMSCHIEGVVISGIIYFLLKSEDWDDDYVTDRGLVGSFDLETEKWRPIIGGPSCQYVSWYDFKLAALSGHLVLCCRKPSSTMASPAMDIWFLSDVHKGYWVKQQSIKVSLLHVRNLAQPLLVLNDGRIAGHNENWAFLKNYTQDIDTSIDVLQMTKCVTVGLYGGNLLSLANGIS